MKPIGYCDEDAGCGCPGGGDPGPGPGGDTCFSVLCDLFYQGDPDNPYPDGGVCAVWLDFSGAQIEDGTCDTCDEIEDWLVYATICLISGETPCEISACAPIGEGCMWAPEEEVDPAVCGDDESEPPCFPYQCANLQVYQEDESGSPNEFTFAVTALATGPAPNTEALCWIRTIDVGRPYLIPSDFNISVFPASVPSNGNDCRQCSAGNPIGNPGTIVVTVADEGCCIDFCTELAGL